MKVAAGLARRPRRCRRGGPPDWPPSSRASAAGRSSSRRPAGTAGSPTRAWEENWLLRRLLQAYLAVGETVDGLIDDADVDWRTERQARLAAGNVIDALAPTNFPWSNPAVLEETSTPAGRTSCQGRAGWPATSRTPPRLPATVDTSQFEVGRQPGGHPGLGGAAQRGARAASSTSPQTEQVREMPLLFVPPTINKYYILDLAPGRSIVEYFVGQGQQVFAISWRNPDQEQGHFDLDTYAQAVSEARDAVAEIPGADAVHLAAACSGGIITAGLLGHLAATGGLGDVASLTLMVCALDNAQAGTISALATRDVAAAAVAESARKGYLDGQALAGVFTWLRPNDLVWSYVVNNYLLGKEPPAFDILYWNQDTVRLAAGLHRDFIHIGLDNSFTQPGRARGARARRSTWQRSTSTLRRRRAQRPHRAVGERVPQRPAVRRQPAVRARRAAATSRRSSTRPRPRERDPLELPRRRRRLRRRGGVRWPRRRSCPGAGGPTGTRGWRSAPASCAGRRGPSATGATSAQAKAPGSYVLAS